MNQLINNRYLVRKKLGVGGMGEVLLVEDQQADRKQFALKKINPTHSQAKMLSEFLRLEFNTLRTFKHPGLAQVHDFGSIDEDGSYYFTSEFVDGHDLKKFLSKKADVSELIDIVVQTLRALAYIHTRGFLHLDIKPANILVCRNDTTVTVKIVDFGASRNQQRVHAGNLVGTPKYIAPELKNGDNADVTADLYSLGITIDATIERFFSNSDDPKVKELQAIAQKLTNFVPYRRFQRANDVIHAINKKFDTDYPIDTEDILTDYVHCPHLIDRELEWATFRRRFDSFLGDRQAAADLPLLLVNGEHGVGKSRFAKECRYELQSHGAKWFQSECGQSELGFTTIVRNIIAAIGIDQPVIKRHLPQLTAILPEFHQTADVTDYPVDQISENIFQFLMDIAEHTKLILCLDSLHRADRLDVQISGYLARSMAVEQGKKLFGLFGLFQMGGEHGSDLIELGHDVNDVSPVLTLNNFSDIKSIKKFIVSTFGDHNVADAFAKKLLSASGGNPRFVEEFLKFHASAQSSLQDLDFSEEAAQRLATPESVSDFTLGAIAHLEDDHKTTLSVLSGFQFGTTIAIAKSAVAKFNTQLPFEDALQKGLEHHLLTSRWIEGELRISFSSDAIRQELYEQIPASDRQRTHATIAEAILDAKQDSMEIELANHLLAAERPDPGIKIALKAINKLMSGYQLETALGLSKKLLKLQKKNEERVENLLRIARISSTLGKNDQARQALDEILKKDKRHLAALIHLAEIDKNTGQFADAKQRCEQILKLKLPEDQRHHLTNLLSEATTLLGNYNQAIEILRPYTVDEGGKGATVHKATSWNTLGLGYYYLGQYDQAIECFKQAIECSNDSTLAKQRITALYRQGMASFNTGNVNMASACYRDAKKQALATSEIKQLCSIELNLGTLNQKQNHIDAAIENYRNGLRIATKMVDYTNQTISHFNLATILGFVGHIEQAKNHAAKALQLSKRYKQKYFLAYSHLLLGSMSTLLGDHRSGRENCLLAARHMRKFGTRRDIGICYAELAKVHRSAGFVRRSRYYVKRVLNAYIDDIDYQVKATALLAHGYDESGAEAGDIDTLQAAIDQLDHDESFPSQDLLWKMHWQLSKICEQHDPPHAQYHVKQSREVFRTLLSNLPSAYRQSFEESPERREIVAHLESNIMQLTKTQMHASDIDQLSRVILSEGHKYAAFFEINRKLNSVLDLDCLLDLIMDILTKMSGAQHGYLLVEDKEGLQTFAYQNLSKDESRASMSVAKMVMDSGKPLITRDAMSDERTKDMNTVIDLQLKSVACLPFRLRNEVIGVVYLEDRSAEGTFDENKVELLEAIADQAAIALHNARMHTKAVGQEKKIRQLNRKLRAQLDEKEKRLQETEKMLANQQYQLVAKYKTHNIIAKSRKMREVLDLVERVSTSDINVLVQGESGTGKELIARAIHYNSERKNKPFLSINCSALNDTLLESELFGHERGSFTGADRLKRGLFESADGGTLFLDEVGDMSKNMQTKLLRALQEGEIRRVGSSSTLKVNVRIISATHRELASMITTNDFREDLFYRLNAVQIALPPLRKRKEDLGLLVRHFIAGSDNPTLKITSEAMARLKNHDWPGNVRELENEINRAIIFAKETIEPEHLSPRMQPQIEQKIFGDDLSELVRGKELAEIMDKLEKEVIESALTLYEGKKGKTAEKLGVTRYTLYRKLKQHALENEDDHGPH